jgi:hypothetical protein
MSEILARISAQGGVELIDEKYVSIDSIGSMSPHDAAYLARGILACAAALSGKQPPRAGAIGGDAHLLITKCTVGLNPLGRVVMILSIPSGIELTFDLSPEDAKGLGSALVNQGREVSPEHGPDTVH